MYVAEGNADLNGVTSPSQSSDSWSNCLQKGGPCLISPSLNLACLSPSLSSNAKRNKPLFLPLKMAPISKKKNTNKNDSKHNRWIKCDYSRMRSLSKKIDIGFKEKKLAFWEIYFPLAETFSISMKRENRETQSIKNIGNENYIMLHINFISIKSKI